MIAGMWLSGPLKPVKDEIMKRGGEERALRRIMTVTKKPAIRKEVTVSL